jgi:hypothetical protein
MYFLYIFLRKKQYITYVFLVRCGQLFVMRLMVASVEHQRGRIHFGLHRCPAQDIDALEAIGAAGSAPLCKSCGDARDAWSKRNGCRYSPAIKAASDSLYERRVRALQLDPHDHGLASKKRDVLP